MESGGAPAPPTIAAAGSDEITRRARAAARNIARISLRQTHKSMSFRPSKARAGIHNPDPWLWIPGSPRCGAPE